MPADVMLSTSPSLPLSQVVRLAVVAVIAFDSDLVVDHRIPICLAQAAENYGWNDADE
jgi:hypothetical protein